MEKIKKESKEKKKNIGKIFEEEIKKSFPKDIYYFKITDAAIGFDITSSKQRFSRKSPYDYFLCKNGHMMALECKCTEGTSINNIEDHQVEELKKVFENGKAIAGFLLCFRKSEKTYFVPIMKYIEWKENCNKKSINEKDTIGIGIEIPGKKKHVYYSWDLTILLEML